MIWFYDPREVVNFSAWPALLPYECMKELQEDIFNFRNSGCSILEISHRSKQYMDLNYETKDLFREVLGIPQDYKILFAHGGASTQFANIAANFRWKQWYLITGDFSQRAYKEAIKVRKAFLWKREVYQVASGEWVNFCSLPSYENIAQGIQENSTYLHITDNNTLYGSTLFEAPETSVPIIADMTSSLLSRNIDVTRYSMIYAGFQKNIAPAGTAVIIMNKELYSSLVDDLPAMYSYKNLIDKESLYNTPSTLNVYMANLVLKWVQQLGWIEIVEKLCRDKSWLLYSTIDESGGFYENNVDVSCRSLTNIIFRLSHKNLEEKFLRVASEHGFINLKGHKNVWGLRASVYISMSYEHVKKFTDFMQKFQQENS